MDDTIEVSGLLTADRHRLLVARQRLGAARFTDVFSATFT
jgi:hypothetical protein